MGAIISPLAVPGLALGALCHALGLPSLGLQTMADTNMGATAAHAYASPVQCMASVSAHKLPRMVVRDFSQSTMREPNEPHATVAAPISTEPLYVVPSVIDSEPAFYAPLKPQPLAAAASGPAADAPESSDAQIEAPPSNIYVPKPLDPLTQGVSTVPQNNESADWHNASTPLEQQELSLLAMVNKEREERGLQTLSLNPLLCQIARAHSEDMCRRNYFDHIAPAPGPASPMDRYLAALGQRPNRAMVGENIYYRSATDTVGAYAAQAHDAFMHSPGHRANILTPQYDQAGIGIYRNPATGEFWVTEEFLTVADVKYTSAPS